MIGIKGNKRKIIRYLYKVSRLVIFSKSEDKQHKKEKGERKLPCGIVKCCSFYTDYINTFSKRKIKGVDLRHNAQRRRKRTAENIPQVKTL